MSQFSPLRIAVTGGARAASIGALSALLLLGACASIPDFRSGARFSSPFARPAPGAPAATPAAPSAPPASAAETACMEAGRQAGFDVRGVVGTREVPGASGLPESRDVMLGVSRGGQSLEVRCSFSYLTGEARMMTL